MVTTFFRSLAAFGAAYVLAAGALHAAEKPADPFSAKALTALPRTGWPTNGGNLFNQRYSPLELINRTNVAQLKGVWRTHLNGSGLAPQFSGAAQPIVHDGRIYIATGQNDVFALDAVTGAILWTWSAKLDLKMSTVCCGWTNRGVGIGDGKLFVGTLDARLVALDLKTGKEVWSTQVERPQDGFSITTAPLYLDGVLVTGIAGAEFGVRGRVKAYDAKTGKPLWTFFTVPGPGEVGHDTWPKDSNAWQRGGATVWQTPAADPELGLIYFSTGNASPDFDGSVRPGDNLFSASIVAIEAKTGKYRWHFQQVHHDIWDYDSPNPVILFDARIDGRLRKGIVEVGKTGWAYILDRETGKPLIGIDEKPVPQEPRQATAATQPYPRGDAIVTQHVDIAPEGYTLVNGGRIFTPFFGNDGLIASPSLYGGANWPPSALDPQRQRLFVCASDVPGNFIGGGEKEKLPSELGKEYLGGKVGFAPLPRSGILASLDVTTNKLVWRQRWMDQCYSGVVATGGGLLFVGRNDGRLTALDSDNGKKLWEFQTGAGMNSTVSTFVRDGKQYVVAYSAGNVLAGSPKGDSVWLFALDGAMPQAKEKDSVTAAPAVAASAPASAAVNSLGTSGADIYRATCLPCHGPDGKGGHGGGAPLDKAKDLTSVMTVIREGRKNMPPFGSALSDAQIQEVARAVVEGIYNP